MFIIIILTKITLTIILAMATIYHNEIIINNIQNVYAHTLLLLI